MTGPDGTHSRGWFRFLPFEPLKRIEVEDGFSDDHSNPNLALPSMRMAFSFSSTPSGPRFEGVTYFPTLEAMEQLVSMGIMEGMRSAMGQIDAVVADLATKVGQALSLPNGSRPTARNDSASSVDSWSRIHRIAP